jgi:hypothetical protein
MVSIRRKLGAFVAAVAIAAVMVMVPATAHAKTNKGGSTLDAFCAQLASAIASVAALDDNLATDLALASLQATYNAYCGQ